MKRTISLVCFLTLSHCLFLPATTHAQDKIIHLKPHEIHGLHSFPYDRVIVLDSRTDSSILGVSGNGQVLRLDGTASETIADYIRNSTRRKVDQRGTLVLKIKKLYYSYSPKKTAAPHFILSTDAWLAKNDSVFYRLKTRYYEKKVFPSGSFSTSLSHLLDRMIKAVAVAPRGHADTLSQNMMEQAVNIRWAKYPIITNTPSPVAGYYPDFAHFRNDSLIYCAFKLRFQKDDTYAIVSPINSNEDAYFINNRIWALRDDKGNLYKHVVHNIFLPLEKKNNTFYFAVPVALPDVDVFNMIRGAGFVPVGEGGSNIDLNGANFGNNPSLGAVVILIGAVIVIACTVQVVRAIEREKHKNDWQKLADPVKEPIKIRHGYRYGTLVMDTGDILYF